MAENSESPIVSPDVTNLAAPLLFGPLLNWTLYGALCVQIYVYSYNFSNDKRYVKFLAYFVFLLETAQTALTGVDVYYWFIAGFGDMERLGHSHFAPIDVPIMTAVTSLIVQGYFCYRIWTLNRWSSWTCWIIAVCSLTQSIGAMWSGIASLITGEFAVSKTALYLWSIPSSLADILIAVAMTLLLRRAGSNFSSFVLIRVVRLTIETNALTASLAISSLVLYAAFPNKIYYAYTYVLWSLCTFLANADQRTEIIGKVYSNTLLVSLNNRIYFREHELPGHGDCAYLTVSDRVRAAVPTPPFFAVHEPRLQESKVSCDSSYPIPMFLTDSVSLSSHTISNVIRFPETPNGR
ncbi:hypothetical protein H4582DRAFT_2069308 [Lactarius indigo]|nr:hypothetical protein H4582DRAFT_2069308 [Lactarius indigo]